MKSGPGDYVHAVVTRVLPLEIHARVGKGEILLLPEDWTWTGQRFADALVKPGDIIYVHLADAMEGKARRATLEQDSGAQGVSAGHRQHQRRRAGHGRRARLRALAVQPRHPGGTADRLQLQNLRLHRGHRGRRQAQRHHRRRAGQLRRLHPAQLRERLQRRDDPHSTPSPSRATFPPSSWPTRVGIHKVIDVAHRFGVTSNIPAYLPIAIGAVEITLEEQVASYSVFPNDGLRVKPRLIKKVSNADGITLWEEPPAVDDVISQQTARTMMTLLQAVTHTAPARRRRN